MRRNAKTFAAFLASDAGQKAVHTSGNSREEDYRLDDNAELVGRSFSGHYTLPEVLALLEDLKIVQAAWDVWNPRVELERIHGDYERSREEFRVVMRTNREARAKHAAGLITGAQLDDSNETAQGALIDAEEAQRTYTQLVTMYDALLR